MEKYALKPLNVMAGLYKNGMEDGWKLYYSYENYDYCPDDPELIVFKSLEALEIRLGIRY